MDFDEEQMLRYARQIVLPEIGGIGQARLLKSKVLVIGAGGLGSPLILYLAAAGVGIIGVVDDDRVELSNLQRQIAHSSDRIGCSKAASAGMAASSLNPEVRFIGHEVRLTANNAAELIETYDLVADGSDNIATRATVHEHCLRLRKTLVSAAVQGLEGQLSTFKAYLGSPHPCYRCLFPELPPADLVPSCAQGGILGPVAGVVGCLQAVEVVKELLGKGGGLSGTLLLYDGLSADVERIRVNRRPGCPLCAA